MIQHNDILYDIYLLSNDTDLVKIPKNETQPPGKNDMAL